MKEGRFLTKLLPACWSLFVGVTLMFLVLSGCSKPEEKTLLPRDSVRETRSATGFSSSAGKKKPTAPSTSRLDVALATGKTSLDIEVSLEPAHPVTGDKLKAKIKSKDGLEELGMLTYVWSINGKIVKNSPEPFLDEPIKCGDFIELRVAPETATDMQDAPRCAVFVGNAPPVVQLVQQSLDEKGRYRAQLKTFDPENEEVSLDLENGPPGMKMDRLTGTIYWDVPPEQAGSFEVSVSARDPQGGQAFLTYRLQVSWQQIEGNEEHETLLSSTQQ